MRAKPSWLRTMAPPQPPPSSSSSSSSWQPTAQHTQATTPSASITGHHVRARMAEKASQSREYWTSVKQRASDLKQQAGPLPRTLRHSFSTSLLNAASSDPASSASSSSTSSAVPGSGLQQDQIFPVLLPGYTFARPPNYDPASGEDELHLVLRGFVARRPAVPGRGQRMFALMARQLARLPKPLASSSAGQLLLHPRPSSTDDASFWPDVPTGQVADAGHEKEHSQPLSERIVEEVADRLDERTIGKLVEKMGALPIDGEGGVHDEPEEMAPGSSSSSGASTPAVAAVPSARHHVPQLRVQSQDLEGDLWESMGSDHAPRSPETMLSQTSTRSSATDLSAGTMGSRQPPSRSSTADSTRAPTRTLRPTAIEPSASTSTIPASRLSRLRGLTPLSSTSLASTRSAPVSDATTVSGAPAATAADSQLVGGSDFWARRTLEEIHALTANLNERLADFWLYRVSGRGVRVEVEGCFLAESEEGEGEWRMLLAQEVKSDAHGMFRLKVNVGPVGVFGDELKRLRCRAVLPANGDVTTPTATEEAEGAATDWCPLDLPPWRRPTLTANAQAGGKQHTSPPSIRLVSDIDDTVRQTNVTSGLKSVFRQVFVLPHDEVAVPGMAEWYRWLRGTASAPSHADKDALEGQATEEQPSAVATTGQRSPLIDGLHFVSNAPVELWRPVTDFLRAAGMPEGAHLHLKSYNSEVETSTSNTTHSGSETSKASPAPAAPPRTSLLSTWLQPASQRKRSAIVSILDDFPHSYFLLVGDTGELDLELYAELAKERPSQVRGLYLRDVSSPSSTATATAGVGEEGEKGSKSASRRAGDWIKAKRPGNVQRAMTVDESILASGLTRPQAASITAATAPVTRVTGGAEAGGGTNSAPSSPRLLVRLTNKDRPPRRNNTATPSDLEALSPLGPPVLPAKPTTTTMAPPSSSAALSPALQTRLVKARALVPPSCELRLFRSGEDVRVESGRLIEKLREEGAGPP